MEDVALDPMQERPRVRRARTGPTARIERVEWVERIDEPIVVVEPGDGVPRPHLLASRPGPEAQRRRVVRVPIFPEPLARADGVEDDVGHARDPLDELEEAAGDVSEPEHVHGARELLRLRVQCGDGLVERNERHAAEARGVPALAEHREPEPPLPDLRLEVRGGRALRGLPVAATVPGLVAEPAGSAAPRGKHLPARGGVLLEEPADPGRELNAPHVHRVGRVAAAAQVRADRREVRVRERLVVEQDPERHRLDRGRVGEPCAQDRLDDARRERRQPRQLEVRRDALLARDAEPEIRLDRRARRDDPDGHQRAVTRLLVANSRREVGQELVRAIRVDEADHAARYPSLRVARA